jgi:hypothetical protein
VFAFTAQAPLAVDRQRLAHAGCSVSVVAQPLTRCSCIGLRLRIGKPGQFSGRSSDTPADFGVQDPGGVGRQGARHCSIVARQIAPLARKPPR